VETGIECFDSSSIVKIQPKISSRQSLGDCKMPIALTIAGSDPCGGAGVQADLKTFHQHRVYGMGVVTLVTVQSTQGVRRVEKLSPDLIGEQLTTVLEDIEPQAIKIGALGSPAVVEVVADILSGVGARLVIDPVLVSKTGQSLADEGTGEAIVKKLFPLATIVTPNVHEAAMLTGMEVKCKDTMAAAAEKLAKMGTRMVVVTAGGIDGPCTDVGYEEGSLTFLPADRIDTTAGHGAGCVFSAAITAHLAERLTPMQALVMAKQFTSAAIRRNPGLGSGRGPLNFFVPV
jgi:hydroxymethylpyrimidine/phosphomethylpyrimidine kinase